MWKMALPLLGRVLLGTILASVGMAEEQSVAALIGGIIIGGSAVPAWYRAKIERMKAGRSAAAMEARFENRMTELEQRHQLQIAQLERMHQGRLAELEERVDFAERLLTKRAISDESG
jgi:hypothetical protein